MRQRKLVEFAAPGELAQSHIHLAQAGIERCFRAFVGMRPNQGERFVESAQRRGIVADLQVDGGNSVEALDLSGCGAETLPQSEPFEKKSEGFRVRGCGQM